MTPAIAAAGAAIKGGMTAAEAAATFGISAAVTAALYGIQHFVGEGRTTANTLTRGLQQEYTDQVLKPLAIINQTDPDTAHALMEQAWPSFYQKFENFASQGKNQRKVVDQMYKTPDWINTVTSIMGRNPFTTQAQTQQQTTNTTNQQDQTNADGDVSTDTANTQNQQQLDEQARQQEQARQDKIAYDLAHQKLLSLGDVSNINTQNQQTTNTQTQNLQSTNNVTNQQDYTSNNGTSAHRQDYSGLISLGSMLGNLFARGSTAKTLPRQDQAGPATTPRGNIYVNAQGGNASNVNSNVNAAAPDDPYGINRLFTMPKPAPPPNTGHTMQSMVQQLMQVGGAA